METVNSFKFSFLETGILSRKISLIVLIGLISLVIFGNTFSNDFQLAWDDNWQFIENPLVYQTTKESILFHFTYFWQDQYSPLNSIYFQLINLILRIIVTTFLNECMLIYLFNSILVFSIAENSINKIPNLTSNVLRSLIINPQQLESAISIWFSSLTFRNNTYAISMIFLAMTIPEWASHVSSFIFSPMYN